MFNICSVTCFWNRLSADGHHGYRNKTYHATGGYFDNYRYGE